MFSRKKMLAAENTKQTKETLFVIILFYFARIPKFLIKMILNKKKTEQQNRKISTKMPQISNEEKIFFFI